MPGKYKVITRCGSARFKDAFVRVQRELTLEGSIVISLGFFADEGEIPMTFIRAPYIASVGEGAEVLAAVDGRIVAARQGTQLVTAFHPELGESTAVHRYFLSMVRESLADGAA